MKSDIVIPPLGESISEATIGEIIAPTGTFTNIDAEILEIETDKLNQVLYSPQAGKVNLTVKTGDTVRIGQIVGTVNSDEAQELKKETKDEKQKTEVKKESEEIENAKAQKSSVPASAPKAASLTSSEEGKATRYTKESFLNEIKNSEKSPTNEVPQVKKPVDILPSSTVTQTQRETRRPLN